MELLNKFKCIKEIKKIRTMELKTYLFLQYTLSFQGESTWESLVPVNNDIDYNGQWYRGMPGAYVFRTFILQLR